ncbi:hypothetical protein AB8O38_06380 [Saccharomonospora xinjiangensis]|uniref:hypothetical protein n=1 Tax=Saccharomonospora xinjiangensis TaxID=75294 RepID=UPI003510158E
MTVSFEIADPRTEPEPFGWSEFRARRGLHAVWDYDLLALEAWAARNPPLLVVARDGTRIVAAATVLVCTPRLRPTYAAVSRKRGPTLKPVWAEVYQPWLSGLPGVVFSDDLDDEARAALLRELERALTRRLGAGLLGVFYRSVGADLAAMLEGRGRLVRQVDTVSVLPNDFADRDGWIASLSRSRRTNVTRALRDVGRRVESGQLVVVGGTARDDLTGGEVADLLNRHRLDRGIPSLDTRSPLLGSYFHSFVRRSDVHTVTYHDSEGRLLAVNTLLDHPQCLVKQHWAALPVAEGGLKNLLFDSFARAVDTLTRTKAAELSAGRRPHDVKHALGFTPRPVFGAVVPRPVMGR